MDSRIPFITERKKDYLIFIPLGPGKSLPK